MKNKPVKDWDYYYFQSRQLHLPKKWELLRRLGQNQLTPQAQLKLEWVIFYYTVGQERKVRTAQHFGITRKTLHKWLARFEERYLSSLEEVSRAPHKTRTRDISLLQRERIIKLRRKHLRWGKMKLQRRYLRMYGEEISSWKFQVIIEEEHLYFDKMAHTRQVRRQKQAREHPRKRITQLTKENKVNHLWHVDTVILTLPEGGYRYLLTAIDEVSKLAYARLVKTHSSKQAADFLKRLHYLTEGEMINLHHDNGSEFAKDFTKACKALALPQWYSRVRTPTDNPVLERFNRTIQEEFVEMTDMGLEDTREFNLSLLDWLIEYNSIRPHQSLDYLTPLEYIDEIKKDKVSPMSPSSTPSCISRGLVVQ